MPDPRKIISYRGRRQGDLLRKKDKQIAIMREALEVYRNQEFWQGITLRETKKPFKYIAERFRGWVVAKEALQKVDKLENS